MIQQIYGYNKLRIGGHVVYWSNWNAGPYSSPGKKLRLGHVLRPLVKGLKLTCG